MSNHDVRLGANQTRDRLAVFERWQKFAVVDVQNLRSHTESLCNLSGLSRPSFGQRSPGHLPVSDISVRH